MQFVEQLHTLPQSAQPLVGQTSQQARTTQLPVITAHVNKIKLPSKQASHNTITSDNSTCECNKLPSKQACTTQLSVITAHVNAINYHQNRHCIVEFIVFTCAVITGNCVVYHWQLCCAMPVLVVIYCIHMCCYHLHLCNKLPSKQARTTELPVITAHVNTINHHQNRHAQQNCK